MPETVMEFETRASLHQLLHEIEEYLKLKYKYKKSDVKSPRSRNKKAKKMEKT